MSWSATSTHFFNTSRDGHSTTSLGSLFQCLTTLSVKKFFPIPNLNLPWHNLRPFPQERARSWSDTSCSLVRALPPLTCARLIYSCISVSPSFPLSAPLSLCRTLLPRSRRVLALALAVCPCPAWQGWDRVPRPPSPTAPTSGAGGSLVVSQLCKFYIVRVFLGRTG